MRGTVREAARVVQTGLVCRKASSARTTVESQTEHGDEFPDVL